MALHVVDAKLKIAISLKRIINSLTDSASFNMNLTNSLILKLTVESDGYLYSEINGGSNSYWEVVRWNWGHDDMTALTYAIFDAFRQIQFSDDIDWHDLPSDDHMALGFFATHTKSDGNLLGETLYIFDCLSNLESLDYGAIEVKIGTLSREDIERAFECHEVNFVEDLGSPSDGLGFVDDIESEVIVSPLAMNELLRKES